MSYTVVGHCFSYVRINLFSFCNYFDSHGVSFNWLVLFKIRDLPFILDETILSPNCTCYVPNFQFKYFEVAFKIFSNWLQNNCVCNNG